jgi:hypothetical protein
LGFLSTEKSSNGWVKVGFIFHAGWVNPKVISQLGRSPKPTFEEMSDSKMDFG